MSKDITSMTPAELGAALDALGQPKYRAEQIFRRLHRGARTFGEMTDIPASLRDVLAETFEFSPPEILTKQVSEKDGTIKILWRFADGETAESVAMEHNHGAAVCVSSQAGCRMGCRFCASALGGFSRNLTPGEILAQVIFSALESPRGRVSNIVLMGMGEPLDNLDNVLRFLELVSHPLGVNIGMRKITLSTCGLIENIDKLGSYNLQLTLSVSLHAADDETRSRLMPVNRSGGVAALLDACRRYFDKTGRRVTFEYALIDGVNDTERHARRLVNLLRGENVHVNLILFNGVPESGFRASGAENAGAFARVLRDGGLNATTRRSLGADIDAACGQLRRRATGDG